MNNHSKPRIQIKSRPSSIEGKFLHIYKMGNHSAVVHDYDIFRHGSLFKAAVHLYHESLREHLMYSAKSYRELLRYLSPAEIAG